MSDRLTVLSPDSDHTASAGLLVVVPQLSLPEILDRKLEEAAEYARAARSPATRRAYDNDWRIFGAWCASFGLAALPATAAIVAMFVNDQARAGKNPATIGRRVAAIGYHYRASGHPAPTAMANAGQLREVIAGIRATHGQVKKRKKAADALILRELLATIDGDGLRALRDRAILAIGMAAALRRSEIVALELDDIELVREGLRITIRKSKTDQAGEGAVIAVPEGTRIRPKDQLLAWLAAAGHTDGKLFRRLTRKDALTDQAMSDKAIERLVKAAALAAGYNPRDFAGHSLRAGFITEGAAQGATIFKLQDVSRHRSVQVLSDYVRNAELFKDHAGDRFL